MTGLSANVASRTTEGVLVADDLIGEIIRDVAELGDRTSPDGQPDMMLVTAEELRGILSERLAASRAARDWRPREDAGELRNCDVAVCDHERRVHTWRVADEDPRPMMLLGGIVLWCLLPVSP